ncbi:MAG: FHA domain-containing protein, partial [Lachnospiraceae bacterium]|nr:FHA domain-containing protein [Lachnospiraceae bacterium]
GFAVAQATPEEPAEDPQPEEKPEVVEDKPQIPVINTGNDSDKEDVPEEGEKNILPIIIIIIAVVVVAVVITVIIILLKNKKKKKQAQANAAVNIIPEPPVQDIGKTEVLIQPSKQGSNTQLLWGNEDERKSSSRIILTDKNDPSKVFSAAISGSVSIGRVDSNDIVLSHDSAVSGHHLEIIKKGNLYYVNDLGSSNGTYLNGTKIHTETAVMTGEVLEIGHTKYTVTIED